MCVVARRVLRDAAGEAVPGLKLSLYAHQRKALKWMMARENVSGDAWSGR